MITQLADRSGVAIDIDAAVDGAIQAKFRNAGQTCVFANRLYVQSTVYDAFAEKFTEHVRKLRVGDGFDPADRHACVGKDRGTCR